MKRVNAFIANITISTLSTLSQQLNDCVIHFKLRNFYMLHVKAAL